MHKRTAGEPIVQGWSLPHHQSTSLAWGICIVSLGWRTGMNFETALRSAIVDFEIDLPGE